MHSKIRGQKQEIEIPRMKLTADLIPPKKGSVSTRPQQWNQW